MTAHIEIVKTDAEQPWHVRVVGANGEKVMAGENLANQADARAEVVLLGELFGLVVTFEPSSTPSWYDLVDETEARLWRRAVHFVDET